MLELPCIIKLCSLVCAVLAAGSSAFDFEFASHLFEVGDRTSEVTLAFRERRQKAVVQKSLDGLRKRVERDYRDWLEREFRRDPLGLAEAQAAILSLDFVLPRCLPASQAIVTAGFDSGAIARLVTRTAAAIDEQFGEGTIGVRILRCLVQRTFEALQADENFCIATEIPFRKRVLSDLETLKRGQQQLTKAVETEKNVPLAVLESIQRQTEQMALRDSRMEQLVRAQIDLYWSLQERLERTGGEAADNAFAVGQARGLLRAGDFPGARAVLAEGRQRLRRRRKQTAIEEAKFAADEAGVARLQFHNDEAAGLYLEAAELIEFDPALRWEYLLLAVLTIAENIQEDREPLLEELRRSGAVFEDPWASTSGTHTGISAPSDSDLKKTTALVIAIRRAPWGVFPGWDELHQLARHMRSIGEQLPSANALLAACALRDRIAVSTGVLTIADPIDIEAEWNAAGDALARLAKEDGFEAAEKLAAGRYELARGSRWDRAFLQGKNEP